MARARARKQRGVFTFLIVVFVLSAGLAGLAVIGGGVAFYATSSQRNVTEVDSQGLTSGTYVRFSLHAEDFLLVENSASAVADILDVHERYVVPLDVYLTDPVVRAYQESAPELIERLKSSSVVSIAYDIRPPSPYFTNFDYAGLAALDDVALADTLRAYESAQLDLQTGELQEVVGGLQFVQDTFENVRAVSLMDARGFEAVLGKLMSQYGVVFAGLSGEWGIEEQIFGLSALPQQEVIDVAGLRGQQAAGIMDRSLEGVDTEATHFVHFEVVDSAFYTARPAWHYVYYSDVDQKIPAQPPFDLGAYQGNVSFQSSDVQQALIDVYESLVAEVSSREHVTGLNAQGLMEVLEN